MFSPERCQLEGMNVLSVTVSEHTWETPQSVTIIKETKSFPGLGGGSHLGWGCGRAPDQSFAPGMCLYCPGHACDSVHRDLSPATPLMPSVTGPHTYCPPMASHHLTSVYLLASLLASYRP